MPKNDGSKDFVKKPILDISKKTVIGGSGVLKDFSDSIIPFFPRVDVESREYFHLLEVDACRICALWSIREWPQIANCKLILRVFELESSHDNRSDAIYSFDVKVNGLRNNWYIHLWNEASSYVCDLGFVDENGFNVLKSSNSVNPLSGTKGELLQFLDTATGEINNFSDADIASNENINNFQLNDLGIENRDRKIDQLSEILKSVGGVEPEGCLFDLKTGEYVVTLKEGIGEGRAEVKSSAKINSTSSGHFYQESQPSSRFSLIIKGDSSPGSVLSVLGENVVVGEAGFFSIRYPLSDEQVKTDAFALFQKHDWISLISDYITASNRAVGNVTVSLSAKGLQEGSSVSILGREHPLPASGKYSLKIAL